MSSVTPAIRSPSVTSSRTQPPPPALGTSEASRCNGDRVPGRSNVMAPRCLKCGVHRRAGHRVQEAFQRLAQVLVGRGQRIADKDETIWLAQQFSDGGVAMHQQTLPGDQERGVGLASAIASAPRARASTPRARNGSRGRSARAAEADPAAARRRRSWALLRGAPKADQLHPPQGDRRDQQPGVTYARGLIQVAVHARLPHLLVGQQLVAVQHAVLRALIKGGRYGSPDANFSS